MTLEELKAELGAILLIEEAAPVEWPRVEQMCLELIGRLAFETEPNYPYDIAYHYLDDADVRRKDAAYGRAQRIRLQRWLGDE